MPSAPQTLWPKTSLQKLGINCPACADGVPLIFEKSALCP